MKSTILIEKYLDGTLKGEKLKDFIHHMDNDKELQELVILHKEIDDSIREDDIDGFKSKLDKVYLEFRKSEDRGKEESVHDLKPSGRMFSMPLRILLVAAGLDIFIIIGVHLYILIQRNNSGDKLYSKYYQPYVSDITVRSEDLTTDRVGDAILHYNESRFDAAYQNFLQIVDSDNDNYMARFYLGLTCMEKDKIDEAIVQFKNIIENSRSPFIYHSQWYLALCYLKNENIEEAKILLEAIISANTFHRKRAEELLKKID